MPVELIGLLEDVQPYEKKDGTFGANITMSKKVNKKTKRVQFTTNDKEMAKKLEELLDTDIILTVELNQNNFGTRIGEILALAS